MLKVRRTVWRQAAREKYFKNAFTCVFCVCECVDHIATWQQATRTRTSKANNNVDTIAAAYNF